MYIGLTYDLRDEYLAAGYSEEETAEFDRADTIDAIDNALRELGHQTDRVGNARALIQRLARGDHWDLVFNICEGLGGAGREAQVPAILDVHEIPYTFADPVVMGVCLHKGLTKTIVRDAGLATPNFIVVDDVRRLTLQSRSSANDAAVSFLGLHDLPAQHPPLGFPLFAKPVAEGTGKGVTPASRIHHTDDVAGICAKLLQRYGQPALIEEYLPGRELTVGILGTGDQARCLGTLEIVLLDDAEPDVYSYVNKERCEELVEYRWVRANGDDQVRLAEQMALTAWRVLGCRDGGRIDLRCDATGNPQFLEANPLAGLHPSHSDLPMLATAIGMSYVELIRQILDSAASRCHASVSTGSGSRAAIYGDGPSEPSYEESR